MQMIPSVLLGLFVPMYMQTITGWWLNSGHAARYTLGALFCLAVAVASVPAGSPRARLIALWAAAQVGLTYWLFIIEPGGPGNIFPIVMVFGAAFSAAAVAAGGGVGWLFTRLFRLIRVS
jgi:hypothetical protein